MQFIHNNLGYRKSGEIVEITLTRGANVRLMDQPNFMKYKAGHDHRYYGGLAKHSPVRLQIPRSGQWHVAIDMQGLRGSTRASVRILPSPLPEIPNVPLTSTPSLIQRPDPSTDGRVYDVFISHASEDKETIVRELAENLRSRGLDVWYDEFTLNIGDSLRQKIDEGLRSSRVGLVVLSPAFMRKGWANYELDGIVTRSVSGEQVLLPIWHNITKQEVIDYSPSLADKIARSTSTHTVAEIATEIAKLIRSQLRQS